MNIFACLLTLAIIRPQNTSPSGPQFRAPLSTPKTQVSTAPPVAPRLDPPNGYKPVQVPDYVADTYMKFATAETAHDFQIFDIEKRVGVLESNREKYDRADIDSLKETRTKALVYLAIGSTLFAIVWGALASLFGFFLKAYISPRLKMLWAILGEKAQGINTQYATYPMPNTISLHADAVDPKAMSPDKTE